jgi:uncharacterized protein (TIGR02145 family)
MHKKGKRIMASYVEKFDPEKMYDGSWCTKEVVKNPQEWAAGPTEQMTAEGMKFRFSWHSLLPAIALLALAANAQELKDTRDGKTYKTVRIIKQLWMAENLNYNANGSKCYGNVSANCDKYGRLYNWKTAKSACPTGWHLPSKEEWDALRESVGPLSVVGKHLKTVNGWNNYGEKSGNGTDKYGFSALPGGTGSSNGSFSDIGSQGYWWTISEQNANIPYCLNIANYADSFGLYNCNDSGLSSIRCVSDRATQIPADTAKPGKPDIKTFTDPRDSKTYKSVKIGTQTWMAENLDYAGKNDEFGVCYFKEETFCKKFGALYSWSEAMKICPPGWHLPRFDEWETLVNFAGGSEIAAKKLKAKRYKEDMWREFSFDGCKYTTKERSNRGKIIVTEQDICASDEFGFSALPGGRKDRFFQGSVVKDEIDRSGNWWSSSEDGDESEAYYLCMMGNGADFANLYLNHKSSLFSVRCVKD